MDCDGRLRHVVDDAMSERDQESRKKKKGLARVLRSQHGPYYTAAEERCRREEGEEEEKEEEEEGGTTILQYRTA
jgi:hypothetical protein